MILNRWHHILCTLLYNKKRYIEDLYYFLIPVSRQILLASLPVLQQNKAVAAFAIIRTRRRYANVRAEQSFHELTDIIQHCENQNVRFKVMRLRRKSYNCIEQCLFTCSIKHV